MALASTGFAEKRKYKRVEDSFPLKLSVRTPYLLRMQLGPEIDAIAGDISAGGVGLYANAEMPSGAILGLTFKIYNESGTAMSQRYRDFELPGRVCYSIPMPDGGYRLGVSFLSISDDDVAFIQNYISSRPAET